MEKNKLYLAVAAVMLIMTTSCSNLTNQTDNDANKPVENQTAVTPVDNENMLDSIDEYVNEIRMNGDMFDIERIKSQSGDAVICSLNGDMVKISMLADSGNSVSADYYIRNHKPVFMNRYVIFDVDSSYMQAVYYINGEVFKYFSDGVEVTDRDSVKLIANLTAHDIAEKL